MADRKVTVLNPLGFQEILQDIDTLKVGSYADYTNINGIKTTTLESDTGTFTGDLTLDRLPTNTNHAANKQYVDSVVAAAEITLTATLPITITEDPDLTFDFDINYATTTTDGSVRFATEAEMTAGTATDVAITPADLEERLGGLDIVDATTTIKGLSRFSTDDETIAGTIAGVDGECSVTPASLRAAMDSPLYVVDCGLYAE
jgi:hypothetical protein